MVNFLCQRLEKKKYSHNAVSGPSGATEQQEEGSEKKEATPSEHQDQDLMDNNSSSPAEAKEMDVGECVCRVSGIVTCLH